MNINHAGCEWNSAFIPFVLSHCAAKFTPYSQTTSRTINKTTKKTHDKHGTNIYKPCSAIIKIFQWLVRILIYFLPRRESVKQRYLPKNVLTLLKMVHGSYWLYDSSLITLKKKDYQRINRLKKTLWFFVFSCLVLKVSLKETIIG